MCWTIIGGGTAGAYLASRLLDNQQSVILIEAGGYRLDDPLCLSKDGIGKVMFNPEYTKEFQVNIEQSDNLFDEHFVRMGSGLGGGSAVNGAYLVYESRKHLQEMGISPDIQDRLKPIFYPKVRPAGDYAQYISQIYGGQARDDYLYIHDEERISSLTFLKKYINHPNLQIITQTTVQKVDDQYIYTQKGKQTYDRLIISCGAGTPELLLRSGLPVNDVFNHVGLELKPENHVDHGQVYFDLTSTEIQEKAGGRYQVLFYNTSILIYDLRPSGKWSPKLSSRGDLYYEGQMLTPEDKQQMENIAQAIMEVIPCKGQPIPSMAYHMVGGSPNKNPLPRVNIVDLSILKVLPEGNTSWTAFLLAEQFIEDINIMF